MVGVAVSIAAYLWNAARKAGLIGHPDWEKYVEAGLHVTQAVLPILSDLMANPEKYKNMTPEQVKQLLLPTSWDDLEAQAIKELGMAPHALPTGQT